jgi:hypothetical protein
MWPHHDLFTLPSCHGVHFIEGETEAEKRGGGLRTGPSLFVIESRKPDLKTQTQISQ